MAYLWHIGHRVDSRGRGSVESQEPSKVSIIQPRSFSSRGEAGVFVLNARVDHVIQNNDECEQLLVLFS